MKNVYLLPVEKQSRLVIDTIENKLYLQGILHEKTINVLPQNIYITNDEVIKEGDYRLNIQRDYFKKSDKEGLDYYNKRNDIFKKIILTTDQVLISNGVQSIDDEFLEWFVKNPSCESVEVLHDYFQVDQNNPILRGSTSLVKQHKIIIPQEEPK